MNIFKIFEVFLLLWKSFHSKLLSDVNFKSHYLIYFMNCISALSPQDLRRALVDFVYFKVTNIYNSINDLSSLSFLNFTVSSPLLDFLFHNPYWVFNHIECLVFTKLIFNSIKKQRDFLHSSYLEYKKYFSCNFNINLTNLERDHIVQISFHSPYFLKCNADKNTNKIDYSDSFEPSSMRFKISAEDYLKSVHSILINEEVIISLVEVNSDQFERISYPDWLYFNNFNFSFPEGLKFHFYLSLLQPECFANICSHCISDFYNYELRQLLFKTDAILYQFLFKTQMLKFDSYNTADLINLVFEDFEGYSSDMNHIKCENCMRDCIPDLDRLFPPKKSSSALLEFQKGLICIHFHSKVLYDTILNTLHIWQSNEAYHRKL